MAKKKLSGNAIPILAASVVVLGTSISAGAQTSKTYQNVSTGFCLDSNGNGEVYAMRCNGGNYQRWERRSQSLVDVSTGFCLDSNGDGKVYTLGCNGGNYQNWK